MKMMTWLKIKSATTIGLAALVAGGVATVAISQTHSDEKLTPQEIFKNAKDTYAGLSSYCDEGKTVAVVNGTTLTTTYSIKLARPNLYRVEWEQPVHASYTNKGLVWSAGAGDYLVMGEGTAMSEKTREAALSSATGISGGAAATIPGTFFNMNWGNEFGGSVSNEKQLASEKIGDVDCYVFESELKGTIKTLWIGKKDFLIHQVRTVTDPEALKAALEHAAKVTGRAPQNMPQGGITSTETHFNIVVNKAFSPADFQR